MKRVPQGFTLIELMVVVIIVAILASIAIPSYRRYVMRTHRTDATSALLRIQAAQEKIFLQNNAYATQLTGPPPAGLNMTALSEGARYDLDILPGAGANYMARARPTATGGQNSDIQCRAFTIDQSGTRKAIDSSGADQTAQCWR